LYRSSRRPVTSRRNPKVFFRKPVSRTTLAQEKIPAAAHPDRIAGSSIFQFRHPCRHRKKQAMRAEGINTLLQVQEQEAIVLPQEELNFMPAVNARDYYGIIYIVYFSWCGIICATGVLSDEKKYGIS